MNKEFRAIDLFCGAGGTSTGLIQAATTSGRKVELTAVNHWDVAIETHSINHPGVRHLCESLDNINPAKIFPDRRINLLVASPECTHHSIARGGVPCSDQSRSTAWKIVEWASALYIDNILIENVPEFESWGPLGADGKPMKSKRGETFQAFRIALQSLGYRVDYRVLNAADYGDPTCRRRLFMIARRGNRKITWPEPTHVENGGKTLFGEIKSWEPARKIIDWSIPGRSIFERERPLAEKTLARIEYGLRKFGGEDFLVKFFGTGRGVSLDRPLPTMTAGGGKFGLVEPFITVLKGKSKVRNIDSPMPTLTTRQNMYLCQPFLTRYHGGADSEKRVHDMDKPLPCVDTSNRYAMVEPFLLPQQGGRKDQLRVRSLDKPLSTITTTGAEMLVDPFIIKYFGTGMNAKSIDRPLDTVTTKDRFALVEVFRRTPGLDIRMRMLQPHELAAAQSFPKGYRFAGTRAEVVKQIGNAVPVRTAEALCKELIK